MTKIKFTLPVRPITKKNAMQILTNPKTGKPFMIPSKQYRDFEKECKPYLRRIKEEIGEINYPINLECVFYIDAHRRCDLTNLLSAIDDTLTASGLIIDDNRDIIAGHDGSRVYCDMRNPRIEIQITELKEYEQWKNTKDIQTSLFN